MAEATIKLNCESINLTETIDKAKQLKSLIEEVKTLAASINLDITINGKPIQKDCQETD